MWMPTAERRRLRTRFVPPFQNGDRLDQPTFHALYAGCPPGFRAELIGGEVHLPSPTLYGHGGPHARLSGWCDRYSEATVGTECLVETTDIIDGESEPQPDVLLRIDPDLGGSSWNTRDGFVAGPVELIAEVANSSASIDLNRKKADYERAGIREYIVVLVQRRAVVWFARRGQRFVELKPDDDGLLKSRVFPGLWLLPEAVFDVNSRRVAAELRRGLVTPEHAAFIEKLEAKAARRRSKKPPAPEAE